MSAIRVMNAFAFLNPSEIEEELINVGERPIEDKAFRDCVSSPLGSRQVVKLLTDFSLFTYVHAHSVSTHRLVQELVRESLDAGEKGKSFVDAVRLLSFVFSKCSSPEDLLGNVGMQERLKAYDLLRNHSKYYLWCKLCFHAFYLQRNMEKLLANPDPECLDSVFVFETAKLLDHCAVYLSANQKQEEAKQALNFSYRLLDWIPEEEYDTIKICLSKNSFFLSHVIPLPKWLQNVIKKCCLPSMSFVESLEGKSKVVIHEESLKENIEKLKSEGNKNFKGGLYQEAVAAFSAAIDKSRNTPFFNALLLTNRASAYIKLNQLDDALRDANEYISRFPDCWKGYARKALALDDKISREITGALAYYYFFLKDGRCIFSQYKPFTEAFLGLKEQISICNSADQLIVTLLSGNLRQDCLRIIILGSKEYKLNNTFIPVTLIVKNCIIVGTKADASVTLKLGSETKVELREKCMLANISFLINKGQIFCCDTSFVRMLNCNFTSNDKVCAAVAAVGAFNAERCNFTNCKAGGLLCVGPGNMVVDNCTFASNVKAGLEVRENGILTVRNSRMYNNSLDGLLIGPGTQRCQAYECQIYHNAREGIAALDGSKCIKLMRNHIFGNDGSGIFVRNSDVDMKENTFSDNEAWGIWSQSNSWCNVSMNDVFHNKRGGIRVGKRLTEKDVPAAVVELNKVHDNFGPGIVDNINDFELDVRHIKSERELFETKGDYKSANCNGNVQCNNEERLISNQPKFFSFWCSGCKGKIVKLKMCGKCFTAGYCNADCQREHWSKHKKLCKVLREKSSLLITLKKKDFYPWVINVHAKRLDEVGPKYSPPPPRNGKRFIVKVQTDFESATLGQPHLLLIYDRSLDVYGFFENEFLDHLVKEFGVLCARKYQEKKLFLYCVFEKSGELRVFINDFSHFLTW